MPEWMKYGYHNDPVTSRTITECAHLGKSFEEMALCVGENLLKKCEKLHQELVKSVQSNLVLASPLATEEKTADKHR